MFPCPSCPNSFETKRGVRVHHWRSHDERLPNRTCASCETDFYSEHERKYCSEECRGSAVSRKGANNPNYRGKTETGQCVVCGSEFTYYPSAKRGLYCSHCVETEAWREPPTLEQTDNPQWTGGKREYTCAVCSATVERYPSEADSTVLCSENCRRDWLSEAFTGDGHPNWKGGQNPNYGPGWRNIRLLALERDGYQCVVCDRSADDLGRNPDVHHIVPVRYFVDGTRYSISDAHSLDNVVSLCPSCHRRAEFGKISRNELAAHVGH